MRPGLGLLQYDGLCISLPVNTTVGLTSIGFIHNCEAVLSFCITYVKLKARTNHKFIYFTECGQSFHGLVCTANLWPMGEVIISYLYEYCY